MAEHTQGISEELKGLKLSEASKSAKKLRLKVDIHTHIIPKTYPDLAEKYGYGGFVKLEHNPDRPGVANMLIDGKFFREIEENCWSCEKRKQECDADQVHVQVMFAYFAKPEHALDLAQRLNNEIARQCDIDPTRFVGLGSLPMQSPELAVGELRRCVETLGLAGVQIGSHVEKMDLDNKAFWPIWAEAERLGACIFVHPWDMMGKSDMPKYWLPWLVGMPAETARAIANMIFGGVFEHFPNLRVAFAHGGGAFPIIAGRIQHGFDCRPDLCATDNPVPPLNYLGKFWVDSLVHEERALKFIVDQIGADRVMLGSDYPFPLGEAHPGKLVEGTELLNEEQKDMILGLNALKFLGVPLSRFIPQEGMEEVSQKMTAEPTSAALELTPSLETAAEQTQAVSTSVDA